MTALSDTNIALSPSLQKGLLKSNALKYHVGCNQVHVNTRGVAFKCNHFKGFPNE